MANIKKRKVDLNEDSLKDLMQETYNEIVDERNRAIVAYKKYGKDINENTDIALVGKITNELLKVIDSSIDKKLKLIKLQSDILFKTSKAIELTEVDGTITEDDKKWLMEEVKKSASNNIKEYEE